MGPFQLGDPSYPFRFKGNFYNVVLINWHKARDVMHLKNIFILQDNIAKINPIFEKCEPGPNEQTNARKLGNYTLCAWKINS